MEIQIELSDTYRYFNELHNPSTKKQTIDVLSKFVDENIVLSNHTVVMMIFLVELSKGNHKVKNEFMVYLRRYNIGYFFSHNWGNGLVCDCIMEYLHDCVDTGKYSIVDYECFFSDLCSGYELDQKCFDVIKTKVKPCATKDGNNSSNSSRRVMSYIIPIPIGFR